MPLDEEAKKQIIEKIREHRRRIWLGEIADVREEKRREIERRLGLTDEEVETPEPMVSKPPRRRLKKREREFRTGEAEESGKSQGIGLIALIITGLITAIALGVLIGYLLAAFL